MFTAPNGGHNTSVEFEALNPSGIVVRVIERTGVFFFTMSEADAVDMHRNLTQFLMANAPEGSEFAMTGGC